MNASPWDEIESVPDWKPGPAVFYGQWHLSEPRKVVWHKGQQPEDFDPAAHDADEARWLLEVTLAPLDPSRQEITRRVVSDTEEWTLFKRGLDALKLRWRELDGRWGSAVAVNTSRVRDVIDGVTRYWTGLQPKALYRDADECAAAARHSRGGATTNGSNADAPAAPAAAAPAASAPPNDREYQTALKFLPGVVRTTAADPERLEAMIAKSPLLSRYFDVNSPEVQEAILAYAGVTANTPST